VWWHSGLDCAGGVVGFVKLGVTALLKALPSDESSGSGVSVCKCDTKVILGFMFDGRAFFVLQSIALWH